VNYAEQTHVKAAVTHRSYRYRCHIIVIIAPFNFGVIVIIRIIYITNYSVVCRRANIKRALQRYFNFISFLTPLTKLLEHLYNSLSLSFFLCVFCVLTASLSAYRCVSISVSTLMLYFWHSCIICYMKFVILDHNFIYNNNNYYYNNNNKSNNNNNNIGRLCYWWMKLDLV